MPATSKTTQKKQENPEVAAVAKAIKVFLDQKVPVNGQPTALGSLHGVYAFYDFRDKPLYVGMSKESLRARIGRHLTNQRTDAVAMGVLDPHEVIWIEVWWFPKGTSANDLQKAEYAVWKNIDANGEFVFNEKDIPNRGAIKLPVPIAEIVVPDEQLSSRTRLDARVARRIQTLSRLSQIINDRELKNSSGLRRTLDRQVIRLQEITKEATKVVSEPIPLEVANDAEI